MIETMGTAGELGDTVDSTERKPLGIGVHFEKSGYMMTTVYSDGSYDEKELIGFDRAPSKILEGLLFADKPIYGISRRSLSVRELRAFFRESGEVVWDTKYIPTTFNLKDNGRVFELF